MSGCFSGRPKQRPISYYIHRATEHYHQALFLASDRDHFQEDFWMLKYTDQAEEASRLYPRRLRVVHCEGPRRERPSRPIMCCLGRPAAVPEIDACLDPIRASFVRGRTPFSQDRCPHLQCPTRVALYLGWYRVQCCSSFSLRLPEAESATHLVLLAGKGKMDWYNHGTINVQQAQEERYTFRYGPSGVGMSCSARGGLRFPADHMKDTSIIRQRHHLC